MQLSVVIVTKNRKKILSRCIQSLLKQSVFPNELIIVDNNSTDGTQLFIKNFMKRAPFPTRYILEKRVGYPVIYNRGLKESKFPWTIFIDDDCVAAPSWLQETIKAISKHNKAAAILGESKTLHKNNVFSLATWFTIHRWKRTAIHNSVVLDYEILDNKNISYNKQFLVKNKLRYDESRSAWAFGAAEDADLGMQIWKAKGKAFYSPNMIVSHEDPITLRAYVDRMKRSIASMVSFEYKWQKERPLMQSLLPKNSFLLSYILFQRSYRIPLYLSVQVFFLLATTYVFVRVYYYFARRAFHAHQHLSHENT